MDEIMRIAPTLTNRGQHQRSLSESGIEETKGKGKGNCIFFFYVMNCVFNVSNNLAKVVRKIYMQIKRTFACF